MKFSTIELRDLFFSWIAISLAFALLFSGNNFSSLNSFFILLLISGFTVGIGFIFHELMHKYVAQKYHLIAEFRAFYLMLFLTIILSFTGFVIAAPGAVIIQGRTTKQKSGKISLAGPLSNLVLGTAFLIFLLILKPTDLLKMFLDYGFKINIFLCLFNLIPFYLFDGGKILYWSKPVYYTVLAVSIILFFVSFLI